MSTPEYSTEPGKPEPIYTDYDLARLRSYAPVVNPAIDRELRDLRLYIEELEAHVRIEIERIDDTLTYHALKIDQVQS